MLVISKEIFDKSLCIRLINIFTGKACLVLMILLNHNIIYVDFSLKHLYIHHVLLLYPRTKVGDT